MLISPNITLFNIICSSSQYSSGAKQKISKIAGNRQNKKCIKKIFLNFKLPRISRWNDYV